MSTTQEEITRQLERELDAALTQPATALLGLDLADTLRTRIAARVPLLAAQLCQDENDRLAAETVIDVMGALWPHGDPDPDWWRTPLGRVCARSLAREEGDAVTYSAAAAMLGVTRGAVAKMASPDRGYLDRHPDGGITRASVLTRIGRSGD